jgi:acetyl/propionyl-CoA carboxylase alpha subunit
MKTKVIINGTEVLVEAQIVAGQLWAHYEGKTLVFENPDKATRRGAKKHHSRNANQITAAMPGKITKLLCKEGENVNEGQALIVMEAMKMEYTLKCEVKAKVKSIKVNLGDQVTMGKLLIDLEEEK